MKRISLTIGEDQIPWLRDRARSERSNVSTVIRQLIDRERRESRQDADRPIEPLRFMLDRTPCWCDAEDGYVLDNDHTGWSHDADCASRRRIASTSLRAARIGESAP